MPEGPLLATLIQQLSALLPQLQANINWQDQIAAVWHSHQIGGRLIACKDTEQIMFDDLLCIDDQKLALDLNTRQFLAGLPANHVLLWGARGSGKSSLVHALLNRYAEQGIRLIQVAKDNLKLFHQIVDIVKKEKYKFILFCDDIAFDDEDSSYRALKSVLEGSVAAAAANVLIYATSNRRHLLPESMADNQKVVVEKYVLHHSEAVEEKISLSDRFGLWLSFHALRQDDYLKIAEHWVCSLARQHTAAVVFDELARAEALRWALKRGSRNGRAAQHFARHWVGRRLLLRQDR